MTLCIEFAPGLGGGDCRKSLRRLGTAQTICGILVGVLAGLAVGRSASAGDSTINDGWDGPGQNAFTLKYYFVNSTADLPVAVQQAEVLRAMNLWSKYAAIDWVQTGSAGESSSADIGWYVGDYGGWSPLDDGPGGVLAHSNYPPPNGIAALAGDVAFDDAETWTTSHTAGVHLFSVALHELGHSLGLGHSTDPKAIMYDQFDYGAFGNALSPDDIATIRSIYAARYPSLSAHVWGRHTWRSDLIIRVGVKDSPGGTILWQTDVQLQSGGSLDDFDYDEIDLTPAAAFFNGSNEWFASITDVFAADTGFLDGFTIRCGSPGNWLVLASTQTGSLVDGGTYTAYIYNAVPEPGALWALAFGGGLLLGGSVRGRRKRR